MTDNAAAVVGANASVTGLTVRIDSSSSADAYVHAHDLVIAFAGFAFTESDYNLTSNDTALIDGISTNTTSVSGLDGVDVRAFHANENNNVGQSPVCICIGPSLSNGGPTMNLTNTASGHQGVTVTASPRLTFGLNENDHTLDSPLANPSSDPNLALYVEAQDEGSSFGGGLNASQAINWNSDVVIYDGPSPYLLIGQNGTTVKAVNITVNCAIPAGSRASRTRPRAPTSTPAARRSSRTSSTPTSVTSRWTPAMERSAAAPTSAAITGGRSRSSRTTRT